MLPRLTTIPLAALLAWIAAVPAAAAPDLSPQDVERLRGYGPHWGLVGATPQNALDAAVRDFAGKAAAVADHFLKHPDSPAPNTAYFFVLQAVGDRRAALVLIRALSDPSEVRIAPVPDRFRHRVPRGRNRLGAGDNDFSQQPAAKAAPRPGQGARSDHRSGCCRSGGLRLDPVESLLPGRRRKLGAAVRPGGKRPARRGLSLRPRAGPPGRPREGDRGPGYAGAIDGAPRDEQGGHQLRVHAAPGLG